MKKKIVILSVAFVALAADTNSQEIKSAQTLEVCNAQVNLWVAQTDIFKPFSPEIRKVMNTLTSKDITGRERLIADCTLTDVDELRAVPEGPQRAAIATEVGNEIRQSQCPA